LQAENSFFKVFSGKPPCFSLIYAVFHFKNSNIPSIYRDKVQNHLSSAQITESAQRHISGL